jgi:transcriptional regulator GlxA family with amidase domain
MISFPQELAVCALLTGAVGLVHSATLTETPYKTYTKNVAIVLYEGVELLDFAGPGEVFASAAGIGADQSVRAFRVYTVAQKKGMVLSQGFVKIEPEYSVDDAPAPDILAIPGGGTDVLLADPKFMAWVKALPPDKLLMTVCTGAFVPASLGLLDGLEATTYYNAIEDLQAQAPKATVHAGRRLVDNGRIVTTAGVSAGIDGALHMVARLLGRYVADRTAEHMEYHWTPEAYLAKTYTQLNPSLDDLGRARQSIEILESEGNRDGALAAWRAMTGRNPDDGYAWYRVGRLLHDAKQYDAAIAAAQHTIDVPDTPASLRGRALFNIACAQALSGKTDAALTALENAVASGFRVRYYLEHEPDLESVRPLPRFQKLLSAL